MRRWIVDKLLEGAKKIVHLSNHLIDIVLHRVAVIKVDKNTVNRFKRAYESLDCCTVCIWDRHNDKTSLMSDLVQVDKEAVNTNIVGILRVIIYIEWTNSSERKTRVGWWGAKEK